MTLFFQIYEFLRKTEMVNKKERMNEWMLDRKRKIIQLLDGSFLHKIRKYII